MGQDARRRGSIDGPSGLLTVGVLTPHAAAGPELELPRMTSGRVSVRISRLGSRQSAGVVAPATTADGLRESARPEAVDAALDRFRGSAIGAVAYASTTTGYVLGRRTEAALADRIAQRCGVPVVAGASAAVRALRRCRTGSFTLIHPPWFDDELDRLGVDYFHDQDLDPVLIKATGLPANPALITTAIVVAELGPLLGDGDEPVFLAGNGFRAASAVEALERLTGRLILQANQVVLRSLLAATGSEWKLTGYGRLFG